MLYVFHGTDIKKVADKTGGLVAGLVAKRPDAQVFSFEGAFTETAALDELVEAQGLFVEKHVVVLKQPFETAESRDMVLERLERIATSQNIFVLAEGKLLAAQKKALEKHAAKIEEHARKDAKVREFNVFALGDALGARDRRALWTGYIQARRSGLEPESISGTLHWAIKGMLAASNAASATESGQKPFVYNKFKRAAGNFTPTELTGLSHSLISLYHDARRSKHAIDTALERWTLNI